MRTDLCAHAGGRNYPPGAVTYMFFAADKGDINTIIGGIAPDWGPFGALGTEAKTMIVNGFFDVFTKELPIEYSVELNRLLQLQMEGAVG